MISAEIDNGHSPELNRASGQNIRKKEYDLMAPDYSCGVICSPATDADLETTLPMIEAFFGDAVASRQTVMDVVRRNRLSAWAMRDAETGTCLGCYAMLFLSEQGAELAAAGKLDARAPRPEWLATPSDPPAAIYKWLIVARGRAYAGIAAIAAFMRQPQFAHLDYYGTALNDDGARFMERYGFERIAPQSPAYRYRRLANRHLAAAS